MRRRTSAVVYFWWALAGLILSVLSLFGYFQQKTPTYLVSRIVDGDTIELSDGRRVRYLGVDTPETGECFATAAADINRSLVLHQTIRLETDTNELDRFGRLLGYVYVDETLVNRELIARGAGEYFEDYLNHKHQAEFIRAAEEAKKNKKGLWSTCAQDEKLGCVIKGNLDPNDRRFYHLPHFRHYSQIIMNLNKGDRWFCSEDEAVKAGFRRARE